MTSFANRLLGPPLVFLFVAISLQSAAQETDISASLKRVRQTLVAPPALPDHSQVALGGPTIIEVRLVIDEKEVEVAPGARIWAMTFAGTVPGPMIVVHENDYVELTLVNPPTNSLLHNIDFHAATGALGGGELTNVAPGQEVVLRFKAVKPGVFVYHCAPGGAMVPLHVVSGMNGAIMVLPRDGLKDEKGNGVRYDRAYYIGEQDFYIPRDESGKHKSYTTPAAGFGLWLRTVIVLDSISLVLDAVDVARYLRGDRTETVAGLEPPIGAIRRRA